MKHSLLWAMLFVCSISFAQNVKWEPLDYGLKGKEFIDDELRLSKSKELRMIAKRTLYSSKIERLEIWTNDKLSKSVSVESKLKGDFIQFVKIGDAGFVLLEKGEGKRDFDFVLVSIDDNGKLGKEVDLFEFSLRKGTTAKDVISIKTSENKKYTMFHSTLAERKSDAVEFDYVIVDGKGKVVNSGSKTFDEGEDRDFSFLTTVLNNGEIWLKVTEILTDKKQIKKEGKDRIQDQYVLVGSDSDKMEWNFLEGKVSKSLLRQIDDERVMITGMNAEGDDKYQWYSAIYNITEGSFEDIYTQDLPDDFQLTDIETTKKEEKRLSKGKKIQRTSMLSYRPLEFFKLENGASVAVFEQYLYYVTSYTDPKTGQTRYTYHYYYDDLAIINYDKSGNITNVRRIAKRQYSTNDSGFRSSAICWLEGNNLKILFNDKIENYSESGKFEAVRGHHVYRKKTNSLAEVTVEIDGEDIQRRLVKGNWKKEIVTPQSCSYDQNYNELVLIKRVKRDFFIAIKDL